MKISEAMKLGLTKLRLPHWANPDAYIELYKDERGYGPWATLHDEWGFKALEEDFKKDPALEIHVKKWLILWDTDDRWVSYEPKVSLKPQ